MERVETTVVKYPNGVFIRTNVTSKWTPVKKSRRDEFMISDNLWEYSDWGNLVDGKLQEDSKDEKLRILPEELVEKILAMVPFPYVFKARVLSKSWLARLSPTSTQDDEEKKRFAISFQKQMREWSINWKVFCPVHDASKDDLLAYDRSSHSWQILPSLSFLPSHVMWRAEHFAMDGALVSWAHEEGLFVANILTREWKQLQPWPKEDEHWDWNRMLLSHTLETYKVILLPYPEEDPEWETLTVIQIYDSATNSWSSVKVALPIDTDYLDNAAYVDGVLYLVTIDYRSTGSLIKVMSLSIKGESLVEDLVAVTQVEVEEGWILSVNPMICNSNLLIIIVEWPRGRKAQVIKIDLGRKQVLGVSQGRPDYPRTRGMPAVSNGDYIFEKVETDGSGVLAYNIRADQWELLPYCMESDRPEMWGEKLYPRSGKDWHSWWHSPCSRWRSSCSFRPGLNPFVAV